MNPPPSHRSRYLGVWNTYMPFFEKVYLPTSCYVTTLTGNLSDKVGYR